MTTASGACLAVDGGPKAVGKFHGVGEPKIGVEEFLALAARFGFTADAMARLRGAVTNADLDPQGPTLSRYITTRPLPAAGERFEQRAREIFGSPMALGVSSGTGALHAALVAAGAEPGKEVIVPAVGFMATAMAAAIAGATPIFCDIDESMQLDPTKIEACITPRTVAVVPTHHWGMVADMEPILAVARRHRLCVIEDCAQSPGASYHGRKVGTVGDLGCFSISAYKIIGGGEGGLVLAKDQRLFDRVNQLAESGGLWRPKRFDPPRYDGELILGTNYRLSELESTVNVVQLGKLEGIVSRYRRNYLRIARQLVRVGEVLPQKVNDADGLIGYQMRFFPQTHALRERLRAALAAEGLPVSSRGPDGPPDWHLCSDMFPLRGKFGAQSRFDQCTVGSDLYRREITLGIDQWWTEADADMVAGAMNKVFSALCTVRSDAVGWL